MRCQLIGTDFPRSTAHGFEVACAPALLPGVGIWGAWGATSWHRSGRAWAAWTGAPGEPQAAAANLNPGGHPCKWAPPGFHLPGVPVYRVDGSRLSPLADR